MNLADVLVKLGTGVGGGAAIYALIELVKAVLQRHGDRAEAAKTETETEVISRDRWFTEADVNYKRLEEQYKECRQELLEARRDHRDEIDELRRAHDTQMGKLIRELSEVKDALSRQVDIVEELLPNVQGVPESKVREIRSANRAVRVALWGRA
jgi:molecular chaperone GrpE (heat shock protein)